MDSAHKSNRKFPGLTDAQLRAAIEEGVTNMRDQARLDMMKEEMARRDAGLSVPFKTPQVSGPVTMRRS